MDDLTYTDAQRRDLGVARAYELSMDYGPGASNSFALSFPLAARPAIEPRSLVYVEGTEFGGIVDRIGVETKDPRRRKAVYRGRTWHGMLAGKVISPDPGQSHYRMAGEANAALLAAVHRIGLADVFTAASNASGIVLDHRIRNEYAYDGILAALRASGAKLKIAWDGARAVLSAEPIRDWSARDELDTDRLGIDLDKSYRPVNHLVCLGAGEMEDRVTVHLYADEAGNVSGVQTLFGADEVARIYDYSNADEAELREKGTEKLRECQNDSTCDADVAEGSDYDVGDILGAYDVDTGLFVSAPIVSKSVTVDRKGSRTSYAVGEIARSASFSGSSESSGGGRTYVAGANVTITGSTISADVGLQDLAEVAGVAEDARAAASNASAAAGGAQQTADAAVAEVSAASPIAASRSGSSVAITHAASGAAAGAYGPAADATPGWGEAVTVGARTSVNATGHVTGMQGRSVRIPDAEASASAHGLMSAADKAKLDGVEAGANDYAHPTTAGSRHIPAGGAPGQVLRWAADGTAAWGEDEDTVYGAATSTQLGLVKPDGVTVKVASDGTMSAEQGGSASFLAAHPPQSLYWTESAESPAQHGGVWERREWPYGRLWARKS